MFGGPQFSNEQRRWSGLAPPLREVTPTPLRPIPGARQTCSVVPLPVAREADVHHALFVAGMEQRRPGLRFGRATGSRRCRLGFMPVEGGWNSIILGYNCYGSWLGGGTQENQPQIQTYAFYFPPFSTYDPQFAFTTPTASSILRKYTPLHILTSLGSCCPWKKSPDVDDF